MSARELTPDQLNAIIIIERVNSSLSVIGCLFIVVTFLSSSAFHKPINRLVFFASVGNIMTNIATLISRSALGNLDGALCQLQGFLIQMFMSADGYWTFAMACNVYLTFFYKYDAEMLRTMEKWYFLGCYGIPFVPAIVYVFITSSDGTHLYGDATLWCWVSKEFDVIRIATFYAPVWVAIFLTFIIYVRTGSKIYKQRRQLMSFNNQHCSTTLTTIDNPFQSTKTTEVHVTSEAVEDSDQPIDLSRLGRGSDASDQVLYSVKISSHPMGTQLTPMSTPTYNKNSSSNLPQSERVQYNRPYVTMDANNAAWSYTKVALLFFTAMLVTWIPSSANRVYSVVHPGFISPSLQFASAFVLPLQGFWNAVIYITTSWKACRAFFLGSLRNPRVTPTIHPAGLSIHGRPDRLGSRDKGNETESTTELASRPGTKGSQR